MEFTEEIIEKSIATSSPMPPPMAPRHPNTYYRRSFREAVTKLAGEACARSAEPFLADDLLRRLLCRSACAIHLRVPAWLLLQCRGEMHQVVGQRAPQRDTTCFV